MVQHCLLAPHLSVLSYQMRKMSKKTKNSDNLCGQKQIKGQTYPQLLFFLVFLINTNPSKLAKRQKNNRNVQKSL